VIALYSLALLVSAALLFLLEPMVGKFVLPLLGSAPEVWPTTVPCEPLSRPAIVLMGRKPRGRLKEPRSHGRSLDGDRSARPDMGSDYGRWPS
jgi:hypothetical protein